MMSILARNNVSIAGTNSEAMVFVHGYGCDKTMWRFVAPDFEADYKIVTYDLTGCGGSDLGAYDFDAYGDLARHAEDLLEICSELNLHDVIAVGHSVGATIAALAANKQPDRFSQIVMVSPSPCFLNDGDYTGGFDREDLEGVVAFMEDNYLGWSEAMAPTIAGDGDDGAATGELNKRFCTNDPSVAKHFGRLTFLGDFRETFKDVSVPSLVLQCSDDALAPVAVGEWLKTNIARAEMRILETTGHCPHMTVPELTNGAIKDYLRASSDRRIR